MAWPQHTKRRSRVEVAPVGMYNGSEGEPCGSFQHYSTNTPKATWFSTSQNRWVCLACAQSLNRAALQSYKPRDAITGQEFLMRMLSQ